jgi:CHAT domain-containing protein/Tfp pilus assembly protein PilF
MAKKDKLKRPRWVIFAFSGLVALFLFDYGFAAEQEHQLTQAEFSEALIKEYSANNEEKFISLIRDHRLFVKPAVNDLIKECLEKELKGKIKESQKAFQIAEKTAASFENIFGEKSLSVGVNYLASWSKSQKANKLKADSLYAAGTGIRAKEPEKAIVIYQNALTIYRSIRDERGEAEVLGGFGLIYSSSLIDYKTAMSYYQEALIKRHKVDDRQLLGNTLQSLGSIYYGYVKDYPEALAFFEKAEKIRSELGDTINLGRTVHLKAATYENLGEFDHALDYYRKSYELNKISGDQTRMGESLLKSGTILNNLGKYNEALDNLSRALEINRALNISLGISDALNQIGFVYINMGDYNTAINKFNEALEINKEQNDLWGIAGVYNNLAVMLQDIGRTEKALGYYLQNLSIYEDLKDQASILITLNNIGTIYFDLKDYSKAEEYHQKGLALCQELQIKDQEPSYLLNLANDQSYLGKTDEALESYNRGFKLAKSLNSPDLIWRFIVGLAEHYERRGEFDKAVALNDTALRIIEDLRNTLQGEEFRTTYMARERYVFEDIINLLGILHRKDKSKGYDTLAFAYEERSKSRVLLDLLTESADTISNKSGQRSEKLKNPEPVSLKEAQALCPDGNTVILEYSVGDSSSYLWVITRSDHALFKLPDRKTLLEQVETIRFALQNPEEKISEFFTQAGNYLYEKLIKPAEPYFSKKSRLIIIPDDILNYLPFEALLTENIVAKEKDSYSSLPFLIKKYPVSYVQSASVLKNLLSEKAVENQSVSGNKSLIAFGDPVYNSGDDSSNSAGMSFNRLEYSGKEVETIASYFPKGSADIFLGMNATEEKVKGKGTLKDYGYVHFAAHGLIDEKKPDLSSIVLTRNDKSGEDGFLRATEIFNLDMNADLVVLSACQTGLGKLVRGEGMVGLTRAFMYAGSPAVMVSLWSVSDISTATLMGEFYKNLLKKNLDKTDALRKAQLAMLKNEKFAQPFYWAPFVIFGDWR